MPLPSRKLSVYPNPWLYIDHLGRPAGRVAFDAYEHTPSRGAVGAKMTDVTLLSAASVTRVAGFDLETNFAHHDSRISYEKDPVQIPPTPYYKDAIRCGDLIAADAQTAAQCGIKFIDPKDALAKAKTDAVARFNSETGPGAYEAFGSVDATFDFSN